MLDYKTAQEILSSLSKSFGVERVSLDDAYGRILAEEIVTDRDYPPFNRATMDGYAVRYEDLEAGEKKFTVLETIFAGQASSKPIVHGQCFKIMTGASVPPSADVVIRIEDTKSHSGYIEVVSTDIRQFQSIAKQGEDVKAGVGLIPAATFCTPAVISVLAALGKNTILVEKLPAVAVFTTGNEVVNIDQPVNPFQIRNSNQYLLKALLHKWNIRPFVCAHIVDDRELLHENFKKALTADIILVSGAVSAGDADFVPEVLEKLGVSKLFHKLAIKPGKPIWCGRMPQKGLVFALPGNPFSSYVTFCLFVETYLSNCFGQGSPEPVQLPLLGERNKKSALDEFFPVLLNEDFSGVTPVFFNSSGDILAALKADGLAHHPAALETLHKDDLVSFLKFR